MSNHQNTLPATNLAAGSSGGEISFKDALNNYTKNTNWWTVFAAFDLPDFDSSPLWISKKVNIPVKEVVEALEGLAILGYLRKSEGRYVPIKGKEFVHIDVSRKSKSEVLEDHAVISGQVLNHLQEESLAAVDHRCFAGTMDILQELYSEISKAFEKAYKKSQEVKNKDRIFKMSFTAVDVLATAKKGKGL